MTQYLEKAFKSDYAYGISSGEPMNGKIKRMMKNEIRQL